MTKFNTLIIPLQDILNLDDSSLFKGLILSNSLKYSDHLTSLELSGNRISFNGASNLFKSLL